MSERVESGTQQPEPARGEPVSAGAGDQPASQQHEPLPETLAEHIRQEVERRFQSAKDRRWAQLEKQYGELKQQQSGAPAQGEADDISAAPAKLLARASRMIADAGLANDPQLGDILESDAYGEGVEGYLALLEDITRLALKRAAKAPASAGSVAQPGGGTAQHDLRQAYEARKRALRPGDVDGLMALKQLFRGQGLDVF